MLAKTSLFRDYPAMAGRYRLNPALLWDCDLQAFDYQAGRALVAERVIERGAPEDFYAAFDLYGGIDTFREIVRDEVRHLWPIDINFVCLFFDLKKEELRCYKSAQLRQQLLRS